MCLRSNLVKKCYDLQNDKMFSIRHGIITCGKVARHGQPFLSTHYFLCHVAHPCFHIVSLYGLWHSSFSILTTYLTSQVFYLKVIYNQNKFLYLVIPAFYYKVNASDLYNSVYCHLCMCIQLLIFNNPNTISLSEVTFA